MPRLRTTDKPYAKMRRLLLGYGLNAPTLADALNVSAPTARKRLENPELLTLKDIDRINRFGVPMEELKGAMIR